MVKIRQACAEGRVSDADALYANYEFREIGESRSNIQWLALQTLGRKAEASALLQPLDKASTLFALSAFLSYTHFDPRPYPTLVATLTASINAKLANPMLKADAKVSLQADLAAVATADGEIKALVGDAKATVTGLPALGVEALAKLTGALAGGASAG